MVTLKALQEAGDREDRMAAGPLAGSHDQAEDEIALLGPSGQHIVDAGTEQHLPNATPGHTEREVWPRLTRCVSKLGSEQVEAINAQVG